MPSQTDGDPLPDVAPARLNGDAPKGLWDGLAAQVGAAGFALLREAPARPGALGSMNRAEMAVRVREDLPPSSGFHCCRSAAIHVEVISASNSGLATSPRTALISGSTVGNPVVTAPIVGASKISHLDDAHCRHDCAAQ
jgi:hypothetical protein